MSNPFIIDADMSRSITPELLKGLQGFVAFINDGTDIEAIFDLAGALANHEISAAAMDSQARSCNRLTICRTIHSTDSESRNVTEAAYKFVRLCLCRPYASSQA